MGGDMGDVERNGNAVCPIFTTLPQGAPTQSKGDPMRKTLLLMACAMPLLGSCGDNPENVPLYGRWEMVRTLDSVTIDGVAFAPDEMPAEFRQMEQSETRCGEPTYTDRAWQEDDVRDRTNGICQLETYTHGPTSAELTGSCSMEGDGATYTPSMRGNSTFAESTTRDVVIMEGTLNMPGDPAPHVLKVIAVQEGTRLGDC